MPTTIDMSSVRCYTRSMTKKTYTEEMLREAAEASVSYAGVLRYLGVPQSGGMQTHIKKRMAVEGVDVSHFTGQGHNRGKPSKTKLTWEQILVARDPLEHKMDTKRLRRALLEMGREHLCESCGIGPEYNGKPLVLEIDHINGESWNNVPDNLRFLCPNCHSQQTNGKPWRNTARVERTKQQRVTPDINRCHCGEIITRSAKTCKTHRVNARKIEWPSRDVVMELVEATNYTQAGKSLGVSDNAVRKYLENTK